MKTNRVNSTFGPAIGGGQTCLVCELQRPIQQSLY